MKDKIQIGQRQVGAGNPVYVIAELSANHGQNLDQAIRLVHAAKASGADAVKLQTFTPDTITLKSDREWFRIEGGTLWDGRNLHDLYSESFMPWEWQPRLKEIAAAIGIDLFSSPFDSSAVEFLETMNVPAFKIASFELVDLPLIEHCARTGKPVILSTGMATIDEIDEAVATARRAGSGGIALLRCNSAYPAAPEEMNLRAIANLRARYSVPIGLSDHTLGIAAAVASVALGACIVEKHFTESRATPGPDSAFSLEPHEFKTMVAAIREAELCLGSEEIAPQRRESNSLRFRRSLFVVKRVQEGEPFTPDNVRSIRPAHGLHTRYLPQVLESYAACDVEPGTPLTWELLDSAPHRRKTSAFPL